MENSIEKNIQQWELNIGPGNGLVPAGNKPLPEPMLTHINVTRPQRVIIQHKHAKQLYPYVTNNGWDRLDFLTNYP